MFAMDVAAAAARAFHSLWKAEENDDERHTERDGEPDQGEWQILARAWWRWSERGPWPHSLYALPALRVANGASLSEVWEVSKGRQPPGVSGREADRLWLDCPQADVTNGRTGWKADPTGLRRFEGSSPRA